MRFSNSSFFLILIVLVSVCAAAPAQPLSQNVEVKAHVTRSTTSMKPKATPPTTSKATSASMKPAASAQAQAPTRPPPVLLSNATALEAGGGTPGGPPPQTSFSANAIRNFKVANFIEGIEFSFFASALLSLSQDANFTQASSDGKSIASITSQIAAQELVHKATLEGLLGLANEPTVPACAKIHPVTITDEFIAKANIVTSAAIGVIITFLSSLAGTDPNLLGPLSSILSVESQQDAFFRMSGSNTPSASPFNTALSNAYAFNIALNMVDPASCPQLPDLPIFPSLNLTYPIMSATAPSTPPTDITFAASGTLSSNDKLFVGWVNQANPVVYTKVAIQNGIGKADIPSGMTGFAFAVLTAQDSDVTVDGLTNRTLSGPATVFMS